MTRQATLSTFALYFSFAAVTGAVILLRCTLAFEFPLPWPDEAAFLSQAFALAHTGSMAVFALNPDRILMWMPPGYMVVLATIFKAFGYGFGLARWISALLFIMAYGCCLLVIRHVLQGRLLVFTLAFSVAVFLTPHVIIIANIARMESMYMFLLLASLLLSVREMPIMGASLAAATIVVHPNAVYFFLPYAMFTAHGLIVGWRIRPATRDWLAMAAAILIISTYGIFCVVNFQGLLSDTQWQLSHKASRAFHGTTIDVVLLAILITTSLVQLAIRKTFRANIFISLYGAAFFLMALYGQEDWYRFGYSLGLLLTLTSVAGELDGFQFSKQRPLLGLIAVLAMGELIHGREPSPAKAPVVMLMRKSILAKTDIKKVNDFIRRLPAGTTVSFAFGFNGIEPFFFKAIAASGSIWTMHTHSATQFAPTRSADYRIRCDSSLYKNVVIPVDDGDYPRTGQDSGCEIIKWGARGGG